MGDKIIENEKKENKLTPKKIIELVNKFLEQGEVEKAGELIEKAPFNEQIKSDEEATQIAELWKLQELIKARVIKPTDFNPNNKVRNIVNSYFDKLDLAEQIWNVQPYFYDDSKIWWLWEEKKSKWDLVDETKILIMVSDNSTANTISSKDKAEILEAMRQFGRKKVPIPIEKTWIQFKDTIVDIKNGNEFKATPKYFVTNPIPWALNKERYVNTPKLDKIFEEWVGKKYVQTLYEILAYGLIPDYPLHRIFCFIGSGMNGKSCFLNLLRKFLGNDNICCTELDSLLNSRFEVTRLHKKLVCQMGETNFSEMNKTSILKKLSGGDLIGYEYKNKNPFEDFNYAKIIIATNNLPTTTDKTIGFYRRWLIIDFPNQFSEQKDILGEITDEEYECLCVKCIGILKDLLERREFNNEGSVEERMKKYEDHSDPLEKFLEEFTTLKDVEGNIPKWELEKTLNEWLVENRHRKMSDRTISKRMKEKGVEDGRVYVDWYDSDTYVKKQVRAWIGIKWKKDRENAQD